MSSMVLIGSIWGFLLVIWYIAKLCSIESQSIDLLELFMSWMWKHQLCHCGLVKNGKVVGVRIYVSYIHITRWSDIRPATSLEWKHNFINIVICFSYWRNGGNIDRQPCLEIMISGDWYGHWRVSFRSTMQWWNINMWHWYIEDKF